MLPINVLSLFDGMSCGRLALAEANIPVSAYYSSEIKPHAIKVADKNYPMDALYRLGDINTIDFSKLKGVDLLIGGSPCQGFSFAGKQLNFDDPRSKLFFKFAEALEVLKPKYFILENVNMKQEYQDVISKILGVKPIRINSAQVSATTRDRLYWTNIPGVVQPKNLGIVFNDIRDSNIDPSLFIPDTYQYDIRTPKKLNTDKPIRLGGYAKQGQGQRIYSMKGKSVCLSALGGGWGAKTGLYYDNGRVRKPTVKELCRLQTVPDNYFDSSDLKYNQIAELLGDGWTIKVISHILSFIK